MATFPASFLALEAVDIDALATIGVELDEEIRVKVDSMCTVPMLRASLIKSARSIQRPVITTLLVVPPDCFCHQRNSHETLFVKFRGENTHPLALNHSPLAQHGRVSCVVRIVRARDRRDRLQGESLTLAASPRCRAENTGTTGTRKVFWELWIASLCALAMSTSPVLWNVEIPSPPARSDFGSCDPLDGRRPKMHGTPPAHGDLVINVTLLLPALHQGVRESVKYLQKHGFQKSKYENVTWPRLRRRPGAREYETAAYASQFATEYIARRLKLPPDDVHEAVKCVDVRDTALGRICPRDLVSEEDLVCPRRALHYRTPDGSCNNFDRPSWGATFSTLVRLLPARYADGISRPRTSVSGSPLPSGRLVSQTLTTLRDRSGSGSSSEDPRVTLMLMQWGQLVDHDVTLTTLSVSRSGFPPRCCRPLMSPEGRAPGVHGHRGVVAGPVLPQVRRDVHGVQPLGARRQARLQVGYDTTRLCCCDE
ncbi:hypothetical protein HPB50_006938 [Hyalomma asiaticum]|uniref:Uncharacterized protein n=1 Tax=Hyalomma asiaticum TaxID=266040 RepID=A0ACB7T8R2_HYAAI|nr:hypothetical protein HPB50_006938 [Hyalomma asiaticum]